VGLGIRGLSWVGLGICKVGGVGSRFMFCSEDNFDKFDISKY